jgi:RHS repeat-associated protein
LSPLPCLSAWTWNPATRIATSAQLTVKDFHCADKCADLRTGPGVDSKAAGRRCGRRGQLGIGGAAPRFRALPPNTYTIFTGLLKYDSFGNLTASSGSIANRFQYTARELDPETGIYFYRARYYDATTGHFLSEDPVGFEGGVNFYPYAENDPVIFSDPFGLQSGTPSGCSPPFRTPCGPSLYGPPVDPTAPPPPTAPTVPSWWPGTGPGSGSGSSASPGSGPSPSPEPSPAPGGGSQQCDQNKGKWHCRAKCYVLRSKGEDIVGVTYGDGYGNSQADAASAALKNAANSTAKGFRTKHCHTVSCEKR